MKGLLWLDGLDVLSLSCKGSVASSFTSFRRTSNVMIYWLRGATVPLGISVAHLPNNGSVAQLYSASDFGSEGWGLESLRGHKRKPSTKVLGFLFLARSKFILKSA